MDRHKASPVAPAKLPPIGTEIEVPNLKHLEVAALTIHAVTHEVMCTVMNIGKKPRYLLSPRSWGNGPGYVCMLEGVHDTRDHIYAVRIVRHGKKCVFGVPLNFKQNSVAQGQGYKDEVTAREASFANYEEDEDERTDEDYAEWLKQQQEDEAHEERVDQDYAEIEERDREQQREKEHQARRAAEDNFDWDQC